MTATYNEIADLYINLAHDHRIDLLDGEPLRARLVYLVLDFLATAGVGEGADPAERTALASLMARAEVWGNDARARVSAFSRVPVSFDIGGELTLSPGVRGRIVDEYRHRGARGADVVSAECFRASYVRQMLHRLYTSVKLGPFMDGERDYLSALCERASAWQDDAFDRHPPA